MDKEIADYLWKSWNEFLGDAKTIDYEYQALNDFLLFLKAKENSPHKGVDK